jgi:hypothetical protein
LVSAKARNGRFSSAAAGSAPIASFPKSRLVYRIVPPAEEIVTGYSTRYNAGAVFTQQSAFAVLAVVALMSAPTVAGQQRPARPALLDVASLVSADRVKVGERFTVRLRLTPSPRMHVYAPTVVNYKPIAFTVRPQPGLIVRRISYPPAERYFYAPLKETVDVYQKTFEVVQELVLDGSPKGRAALKGVSTVTIQGTLSYQACDDKICYPPRTVPMTWTVGIKES